MIISFQDQIGIEETETTTRVGTKEISATEITKTEVPIDPRKGIITETRNKITAERDTLEDVETVANMSGILGLIVTIKR